MHIHIRYVYMYVCMYVCIYVCMYVCMYVCLYVRTHVCMYSFNRCIYKYVYYMYIGSGAEQEPARRLFEQLRPALQKEARNGGDSRAEADAVYFGGSFDISLISVSIYLCI